MWELENIITKKVRFDLSSSGEPDVYVTQLWNDDVELINACEYVNWSDSEYQFLICDSCGYVGCKSRDWVEIKRTESIALIMPAFRRLSETSEFIRDHYLPPYYLCDRGVIFSDREHYDNKLYPITSFPEFEQLPLLSAWEAVKLFQFEAPNRILGYIFNPPELYRDIIIASSDGNFMEQTPELMTLMNNLSTSSSTVKLRKMTEQDQVISFYLDISGFPEWAALSYDGSQYSLYLEPGYVIESGRSTQRPHGASPSLNAKPKKFEALRSKRRQRKEHSE
jgi:hypothetical protein